MRHTCRLVDHWCNFIQRMEHAEHSGQRLPENLKNEIKMCVLQRPVIIKVHINRKSFLKEFLTMKFNMHLGEPSCVSDCVCFRSNRSPNLVAQTSET